MKHRSLFLLFALAASACTQEAAVPPASTEATIADATTTVAPVPTEVAPTQAEEQAPDTAPDTTPENTTPVEPEVPESTMAPTTTIAATDSPTTVSTEYFIGGEPDGWLYLGRWTGNDWEADRDENQVLRTPTIGDGDSVNVTELDVAPIVGSTEGIAEACADGRTGPVISPNARAPQIPGFGYRSIAFPADWSTQPRPAVLVDASVDSYLDAGRAAFDDLDIDTADAAIAQLVVSDLDGDGDTEALVAFDGTGFSALLLIDADSGAAITLARSVTETPTAVDDEEPDPAAVTPNESFRVLAVADVNGDAQSEIVTHAFEGNSAVVSLNVYDGTEVTPVLTAGC
ncbi:MAG: hypothetical protein AB8G14_09090 [Ilumatobacter sp.]